MKPPPGALDILLKKAASSESLASALTATEGDSHQPAGDEGSDSGQQDRDLASKGLANSSNCKSAWMRFMRRAKRKDFALGAELEHDANDLFNLLLREKEDMSKVSVLMKRKRTAETKGSSNWVTMKKKEIEERYGSDKAQAIIAKKRRQGLWCMDGPSSADQVILWGRHI